MLDWKSCIDCGDDVPTERYQAFCKFCEQDRATLLSINPYRDFVIEEVAQHVEKMSPMVAGYLAMYIRKDLANYIREMKK